MTDRSRLLILWRALPVHYDATSNRIYNLLKKGAKKSFDITLACYENGLNIKQIEEIKEYCREVIIVRKPNNSVILNTLKEAVLSPLFLRKRNLPTHLYSREMQQTVNSLIAHNDFDLIYCDRPMVHYISDLKQPKILDLVDPVLYSRWQLFRSETNLIKKGISLAGYYHIKYCEIPDYSKFDACVTVSPFHKKLIESYHAKNVFAIPYGVDLDYFKPDQNKTEYKQTLIFTGAMNYIHNVKAVDWFYHHVYPKILEKFPATRLLVVGKNPPKEIVALSKNSNVTVTGYVDDVRPYFEQAVIDIVPIVTDDGGFKTKILEAMAMGKPVVSTSIGAQGINAVDGKNIILADGAPLFAERVCDLLLNDSLRKTIGMNGRKLVETYYSWKEMSNMLSNTLQQFVVRKPEH